jgi:hypothetical protein
VVSLLALFVALGGSAYAAVKLSPNSVGSRQVKPDSLTGADIREGKLGTVPSAAAAGDAGSLDGLDSSAFARSGLTWTSVPKAHQSGDPPGRFICFTSDGVECNRFFQNFDEVGAHANAAYARDGFGVVRLQGSVRYVAPDTDPSTEPFLQLPAGYRPPDRRVFAVLRNGTELARMDVDADGFLWIVPEYEPGDWFSLDGVEFPAAPQP